MLYTYMRQTAFHTYDQYQIDTNQSGLSPNGGLSFNGVQRLPTEAVGKFTLQLSNVVIGSAVSVEVASTKTNLYYAIAASSDISILLDTFAQGSSKNDLVIKVRKASGAPYYQSYDTKATSYLGSFKIFINQVRDDV